MVDIREAALGLGQRLDRAVSFTGAPAATAWLVDCAKADAWWGTPQVSLAQMLDWTAAWVSQGHRSLGKPTHFEVRDGHY
jgi:hypothetical protein